MSHIAQPGSSKPIVSNDTETPYLVHGRVMVASGHEVACRATAISLEAVEILADATVEPGEAVVCFLAKVGILLGRVTRITEKGFALQVFLPEFRRGSVAARLEWHARRGALLAELRAAPRVVPLHRQVEIRLGPDIVLQGEIQNISRTGAAIALGSHAAPFVGARVQVGARYATVVRHFEGGVAVQFTEPFAATGFNERVRP